MSKDEKNRIKVDQDFLAAYLQAREAVSKFQQRHEEAQRRLVEAQLAARAAEEAYQLAARAHDRELSWFRRMHKIPDTASIEFVPGKENGVDVVYAVWSNPPAPET